MDAKDVISIARDFSVNPGPRHRVEGDFSGEQFRDEILEPRFCAAEQAGRQLTVILDGTLGYGTSFLEEAFGGLARLHTPDRVKAVLEIVSEEEPYLKDDVSEYITEATA